MKRLIACALFATTAGGGMLAAGNAQTPQLAMLDKLQTGSWVLRYRNDARANERICLSNGRQLIQLRHDQKNCRRAIVGDSALQVTVQYTCPGHGYGRTDIRRESNQLVQIESQGIKDGVPFAFTAEARRVGSCRN